MSERNDHGDELELPLYDYEIIAAATEGFSTSNKLGEGGFGPVYKVNKLGLSLPRALKSKIAD